jgi:hypothetical protein
VLVVRDGVLVGKVRSCLVAGAPAVRDRLLHIAELFSILPTGMMLYSSLAILWPIQ